MEVTMEDYMVCPACKKDLWYIGVEDEILDMEAETYTVVDKYRCVYCGRHYREITEFNITFHSRVWETVEESD